MKSILGTVLLATSFTLLAGCAAPLGPAAPIEDRAHDQNAARSPLPRAGVRSIPLPDPMAAPKAKPLAKQKPALRMPPPTSTAHLLPVPPVQAEQPGPSGGPPSAATAPALESAIVPLPAPVEGLPAVARDDAAPASALTGPAAAPLSPAVQGLLAAAQQSAAQGNWDRAQAALERAIKLAPARSVLWQRLAYTHLQTGQLDRAREVAQRALVLAAVDGQENVAAWRLIAAIEQARGDSAAATTARANVTRLAQ